MNECENILIKAKQKACEKCGCTVSPRFYFIYEKSYPFSQDLGFYAKREDISKINEGLKYVKVVCKNCRYNKKTDEEKLIVRKRNQKLWLEKNGGYNKKYKHHKKKQIIKLREWYKDIKKKGKCEMCGKNGEDNPNAFSFHHRNSETKTEIISVMVQRRLSRAKIIMEMEKCMYLCENCHRELHWNRNTEKGTKRNKKVLWLHELKKGKKCSICGNEFHPASLDFHHIDRNSKTDNVSTMLKDYKTFLQMEEEINKCIIVCANCHRKI